jgi:signal transduction histidine kinase
MAALSAPPTEASATVIKHAMERIAANVERVRHLTDELAHFARQSKGEVARAPVDMRAMATEAAADLRADWPDTVFRIESMPPCEGDDALLRQVWRQLLGLAARFAAEGSTRRVRARFEDGTYCVEDEADSQPANAVAKLAGVARLLRDEAQSAEAGVRISIAKHIVERHGGRVSAEPKGNGTTMMRFSIPHPSVT